MTKGYTVDDILALEPCEDYTREALLALLPEGRDSLTAEEITGLDIPVAHQVWCLIGLLPPREQRLFAVWCAREALKLVKDPDPRSVAAIDTAERYANGEATDEELAIAGAAAWTATQDDVQWMALGTAWDSTQHDARDAAVEAAWNSAWSTDWVTAAREHQLAKLIETHKETDK